MLLSNRPKQLITINASFIAESLVVTQVPKLNDLAKDSNNNPLLLMARLLQRPYFTEYRAALITAALITKANSGSRKPHHAERSSVPSWLLRQTRFWNPTQVEHLTIEPEDEKPRRKQSVPNEKWFLCLLAKDRPELFLRRWSINQNEKIKDAVRRGDLFQTAIYKRKLLRGSRDGDSAQDCRSDRQMIKLPNWLVESPNRRTPLGGASRGGRHISRKRQGLRGLSN